MAEERQVIRLGGSKGVSGVSAIWEIQYRGRSRSVDREWMQKGLKEGWLTGVESVRRTDGDWGPLFGRPVYRSVFKRKGLEPRDHAKARARVAIARQRRITRALIGAAALCMVVGLPVFSTALVTQLMLLGAASFAIAAGLMRLRTTMAQVELDALKERLVPPVTAPPPIEDWAMEAANDEVEAYLASVGSDGGTEGAETAPKSPAGAGSLDEGV